MRPPPNYYDPHHPSWRLLLSYLSKHQRQTLREHKFFYVQAKGGRIYGLPARSNDTVFVAINKKTGRPETVYGAFLIEDEAYECCRSDNLLALFLALTTKPKRLLDIACVDECSYANDALNSGRYLKGFLKERARS